MSDQPKPMTSELSAISLVRCHNAALADLLPDERWVTQQLQASNKLCEGLQEQLDAEREKLTLATQMVQIESKRANKAEQKVKSLVDALQDIASGVPDRKQMIQVADLALAKVKK